MWAGSIGVGLVWGWLAILAGRGGARPVRALLSAAAGSAVVAAEVGLLGGAGAVIAFLLAAGGGALTHAVWIHTLRVHAGTSSPLVGPTEGGLR